MLPPSARINRWAAFFFAVCAAVSFSCFSNSIHKFFALDESDIAIRAHMLLEVGPKGPEMAMRSSEGMTHPPLYEYTMALIFRLFGETEQSARGFGIFCYFWIAFFTFRTWLRLTEGESNFFRNAGLLVGVTLYLVNPLLVQHSMLLDADTTLIPLFTSWFAYIFVRSEPKEGKAYLFSRFYLAVLIALAFLSKEITPCFLIAAVFIYRALNREWKKLLTDLALVFFLGFFIAFSVWAVFCFVTGTDPLIFMHKQVGYRGSQVLRWEFLRRVLLATFKLGRWPVFWASAPFFILVGWCYWTRIVQFFSQKRLALIDYCLLTAIVIWTPYYFFKGSIDMMKYQQATYPFFILGILYCLLQVLKPMESILRTGIERKKNWILFFAFSSAVTAYYYGLKDYIRLLFYRRGSEQWDTLFFRYFLPLCILAILVAVYCFLKKEYRRQAPVLAALFLIYPINIALDLRQIAPYATVESWTNYGEKGLKETVEYLSVRVTDQSAITVRKDVLYYLRHRKNIRPRVSMDLYSFFQLKNREVVERLLKENTFHYIVIDSVSFSYIPRNMMMGEIIMKYYHPKVAFGDFTLWVPKP